VELLCAIPARVIETKRIWLAIGSVVAVDFGVAVMLWTLGVGLGLLLTSDRWTKESEATTAIQRWQRSLLAVCLVLMSALVAWFGLYGDKHIATYSKMGDPFN